MFFTFKTYNYLQLQLKLTIFSVVETRKNACNEFEKRFLQFDE